ncbi:hypothetical protein YQE_00926, partial [Dendroctonus ponderosae]
MKAPSFRCTERPEDGALVLHYYSDRPGLEHIVIGGIPENNSRPHRALIVREYRNEVGIQRLVWPARSPDLNVIEPVWDQLKRRIRRRDLTPENLAELENAVLQEWHNIPQELIRKLLYGISRRLSDIIRARCVNTPY